MDLIRSNSCAYDQIFCAPCRARSSSAGEQQRVGACGAAPRREAYGPTEPELDIHRTAPNAQYLFIHGGAWLGGRPRTTLCGGMFVNAARIS
jgi:hypothetical protein